MQLVCAKETGDVRAYLPEAGDYVARAIANSQNYEQRFGFH